MVRLGNPKFPQNLQEVPARLGKDTFMYYPTTILGRQPKKEAYFKLRFRLKLIGLGWNRLGLGWNRLNLWL